MSPGDSFGRFKIQRLLGEGGTAVVYEAYDPKHDRNVALKLLKLEWHAEREVLDRFLHEARAAGALIHPHIVVIYESGSEPEPYIAMELVEGPSLAELIRSRGRLPADEALAILRPIAEALAYAHARRRIHRDIKPSNILLAGPPPTPKLADFGIARIAQAEATQVTRFGRAPGTPRYMSPEQWRGEPVDARSDLFSLGVTLYEMLAGSPAFGGESIETLGYEITSAAPRPLRRLVPDLPAGLAAIVERLIAKNPADRFQSAPELLAAIDALGRKRRPAALGRTAAIGAAAGAVLLLAAALALIFWPRNHPPSAGSVAVAADAWGPVEIDLAPHVADPDGDPLTLAAEPRPGVPGRVTAAGLRLRFDPAGLPPPSPGIGGRTVLRIGYRVADGRGGVTAGEIMLSLRAANNPPIAVEDRVRTMAGSRVIIDVLANDRDPDPGDALELVGAEMAPGSPGTVRLAGRLLYFDPGSTLGPAEAEIRYLLRDRAGATAAGRARIAIEPRLRSAVPPPMALRSQAQRPAPPGASMPAEPAPLGPEPALLPADEAAWREIARAALGMPCAWVEAEPRAPALHLVGVVGDEAGRARLAALAAAMPAVRGLRLATLDAAPGLCAVVDLVRAHAEPQPVRMLRLVPPADDACAGTACYKGLAAYRLAEGERLVLQLTGPEFASHVIVDYFAADGGVAHLHPAAAPGTAALAAAGYARRLAAGGRLFLGDGRAGAAYTVYPVGPPFGRELILMLASRKPLFTSARPAVEPSVPYLAALGQALAAGGERVRASLMPIETGPP